MSQALVVFNAGSSSLKFSVHATDALGAPWVHGQIEGLGAAARLTAHDARGLDTLQHAWPAGTQVDHDTALRHLLQALAPMLKGHSLCAAGHRIVHGGAHRTDPVLLDEAMLMELQALSPLAPLHQPHNLAAVRALQRVAPGLPQVGCFDTAFHAGSPSVAQRFALPRALHDAGVRRYGFHGLSYEHIARRLQALDPEAAAGRTVALHLGNGASACAILAGRSVASSMGFTALDGLVMGTRCGQLDAGVLLWLMDERGLGARDIEHLLYRESGLLGVSGGLSSDMRVLLASDRPEAREAVDLFVHRAVCEVGALAAAMGGLDAVVFTAGIGEHAAPIRARVLQALGWLGAGVDAQANEAAVALPDDEARCISPAGGRVRAWVIPTDEEGAIARHTRRLVLGA